MKTFKFSLVLRTRENTDVFITVDDNIYGIHSKRVNILYIFWIPTSISNIIYTYFTAKKCYSCKLSMCPFVSFHTIIYWTHTHTHARTHARMHKESLHLCNGNRTHGARPHASLHFSSWPGLKCFGLSDNTILKLFVLLLCTKRLECWERGRQTTFPCVFQSFLR